ncbi:MAG: hypothetical protein ABFS34_15425 [Gemmatimonadota bacterium]
MSWPTRMMTLLSISALAVGCGDAILFLGDVPARMRLVAGAPGERGTATGETALDSRFQGPQGLVASADGTLFIADAPVGRVLRLDVDGTLTALYDLRECDQSCPLAPAGLALNAEGDLLVADPGGRRVWLLDPVSGQRAAFAGDGSSVPAPDGVDRLAGGLVAPSDVAVGPEGTVYVADDGAHRVRAVDSEGLLATVAGTGEEGDDGDGGAALAARMDRPVGLALVGETLFVADSASHRVRAVSLADGTIEGVAGSGDLGFGGDGRAGLEARLSAPQGLAASGDGATLFIADVGNHRVRVLDRATGIVRTFAGNGETAFAGDGLPAGATALDAPWALALAGGVLFVADRAQFIVLRTEVLGVTE